MPIFQINVATEELRGCRLALERIATALEHALALPEVKLPAKLSGPESVGSYGESSTLTSGEGPTAENIREQLRQAGLTDADIEDQIVQMLDREGMEL
jgi:hypothetical protein